MANVLESIRAKAKSLGRKVCLTESDDPRNLKAAEKLAKLGYVKPVLVGDEDAIRKLAAENGVSLDGVEVVDVLKTPNLQKYIDICVEIRKNKGLTPEQAREWLKDTCVFSAAMVCAGDAHGYVSGGGNPNGYAHNTAQKTKPALQLFIQGSARPVHQQQGNLVPGVAETGQQVRDQPLGRAAAATRRFGRVRGTVFHSVGHAYRACRTADGRSPAS